MILTHDDVSTDFRWNKYDQYVASELIKREGSPLAVAYFNDVCEGLSDYAYWFFLSTIWVSYSGNSDLNLWKKLFSSKRPRRKTSIMKPSEVKEFNKLRNAIVVYRAHKLGETDWIAYTTDLNTAIGFSVGHEISNIKKYIVKKKDITALFTRRGENEIILLDKEKAIFKEGIK